MAKPAVAEARAVAAPEPAIAVAATVAETPARLGQPLTQQGLAKAADILGADLAAIWALIDTLSGGCGFLPDRTPLIYFDLAQFNRETNGRFPDFVGTPPRRGSMGSFGVAQHARFSEACTLDAIAAARASRWGLFQLSGHGFARAGFDSLESFVEAMRASEDEQLQAAVGFFRRRQLDAALRVRDWAGLSRELIGQDYREDEFDRRLAAAYHKYNYGYLPDVTVRSAQIMLRYLGHDPGPVDGTLSFWTRGAIGAFMLAETGKASFACDRKLVTLLREKSQL